MVPTSQMIVGECFHIMKIAQVAPLYERVPPVGYGGTERVVSWLTEELVRRGHDVTLFASGDSCTSARLISGGAAALRTNPDCKDFLAHHLVMLEELRRHREEFDIVHFHTDYLHFPLCRECGLTSITTLHGRLDIPDLVPLYREFVDMPVVSISFRQRLPLPGANWIGNVYHGLPEHTLPFQGNPGRYLAFIGRISPEKRPDRAIEIATLAGMQLKIAAKVDRVDQAYFESMIKPLLTRTNVEFVGEIGDEQKADFLGNAVACLSPIDWPEPFGLNMIEAMACGTPIVAFRNGSVPELIVNGVSGVIVENVEQAVRAVKQVQAMSRETCRNAFLQRFTVGRMADEYVELYRRLIEKPLAFSKFAIGKSKFEAELAEDAA
jgi:glycosyltransferase involved in cell wall biosynthesis